MREPGVVDGAEADPAAAGPPSRSIAAAAWPDYLRPLRFDHWIKNPVVPVGSLLALAAHRPAPGAPRPGSILLAFLVSGRVSSVNYAINEILDAPFDARHPVKRFRPIPSGRVRVAPLLALTAAVGLLALGVASVALALPPCSAARPPCSSPGSSTTCRRSGSRTGRSSTRSSESLTNPIRIAIGWYAVRPPRRASDAPAGHRVGVRRVPHDRQAAGGAAAARRHRGATTGRRSAPTRSTRLLAVQLAYALAGLRRAGASSSRRSARGAAGPPAGGGARSAGRSR